MQGWAEESTRESPMMGQGSPRLVGQGEVGCWEGTPGSSIPSLQGRWLHLLLTHHPELLSWQHMLGFRKNRYFCLFTQEGGSIPVF